MTYRFETSQSSDVFTARVSGERPESPVESVNVLMNFWSGVASEMKVSGLHRLLAVVSARGTFRSLDLPAFYRRLSEMGFSANMRMAVVSDALPHERPVHQLGVDVASQDGWTICLFATEIEGRAWLEIDQKA